MWKIVIAIIASVALFTILLVLYIRSHYVWIPAMIKNPMMADGTNVLQTTIPVVPDGYDNHFGAADPFIASDYVFAEIMKNGKGVIAVANWNDTKLLFTPVLEEKFHLSYPQVFQHYGKWYMIPESYQSGAILLYQAKNFPYEWEKVETIYDIDGIDSTIFNISNQWYMFTTSNKTSKNLILTTNHFPYGPWSVIKENPLPTGYRGGGRAFYQDGKVLIPLQSPTTFLQGYGYKLEVYEVNPDLSMEHVRTIKPPKGLPNGLHHLDCSNGNTNQCMVDLRMYKKR